MRHWIIRAAILAVPITGASLAIAFSDGPPASHTGAPAVGGVGAEQVCTACHATFPLNAVGATLEILDVPEFYLPDTVYTLRVRLSSTFAGGRRWGFQITAVRATTGQGVGTFDITGFSGIRILSGAGVFASRRYVEHNANGTFPNVAGPVEWTFRWRAPATNVGRIFFFAAGNAANNSGTNNGDHIYTKRDTTDIHPLLDAPAPIAGVAALEPASPNPFRSSTVFAYTLSRAGRVELAIFDAQGRQVRSLLAGERPAGHATVSWDGRAEGGAAAAGVYIVRLRAPGVSPALSQRVVLAR